MTDPNQLDSLNISGQLKKLEEGSSFHALQKQLEEQSVERLRKLVEEMQKVRVQHTQSPLQAALSDAVSNLLSPYVAFVQLGQQLATGLSQLFEPIQKIRAAFAAIPPEQLKAFVDKLSRFNEEFWRHLDEHERTTFALLGRLGLPSLETVFTYQDFDTILQLQKEQGDQAVLDYVFAKLRAADYHLLDRIVKSWFAIPYMAARRRVITSAINAHKRGEYDLSIPALLPLIDGLADEIAITFPTPPKTVIKVKDVAQEYLKMEPELSSECLVQVVETIMFQYVDFRKPNASTTAHNRHSILHGRVANYGEELVSYQVILLLNMTVEVHQKLVPAGDASAAC